MALTKQVQDKLTEIETRYEAILAQINDPEFSSDYQNYMQAAKGKISCCCGRQGSQTVRGQKFLSET